MPRRKNEKRLLGILQALLTFIAAVLVLLIIRGLWVLFRIWWVGENWGA